MLGAFVDSFLLMLIPALWVPLVLSVVKCSLVLHSGTSGRVIVYEDLGCYRVIHLFTGRCSTDNMFPLIGIVAWYYGSWCVRRPKRQDWVLELPLLGAKRGFIVVPFLVFDWVIGIHVVRGFIGSSVVHTQPQSAVPHRKWGRCCRRRW